MSISEQLRQGIVDGTYTVGEKLPSERELMAMFQVSRITIRRAIANLIDQGLAIAHQGKGVFVTDRQKVLYNLTSPGLHLAQDLAQQGIDLSIETLGFELTVPPEATRQVLGLSAQAPAYLQTKRLRMNDVIGCVDITYLVEEIGQSLEDELIQAMTFPVLERHGIEIERVEAVIECRNADRTLSDYLEVPLGHALLVYRHTAYSAPHRPILHGETISRGDRFCYSLDLTGHRST